MRSEILLEREVCDHKGEQCIQHDRGSHHQSPKEIQDTVHGAIPSLLGLFRITFILRDPLTCTLRVSVFWDSHFWRELSFSPLP